MNLSTDLLLQFARTTKDSTNKKTETTVYGTIVEYSGSNYVKIDGSDQLTPADSTVSIKPGDRVTVLLKNHTATITGNISSPAASDESVEVVVGDIAEFNKVLSNYAKVTDLNVEKARIDDLITDYAVINENLTANTADILSLKTDKLSAKDIEGKYANIDFSNITNATMEWFYSHSGLIQNVTVGNETITGELVGVTLKGDLIEGSTIKAEKLVVKGSDGLYYKLNTDGVTVEAEQTDYNSLNGSIITAKSITASKISVDDLVAFDATIGGFNITDSSIYSGVKESIDNTTSGVYLDKYGQIALGDSLNFIKYYKDQNGNYKLDISAESITFGANNQNLATTINNIQTTSDAAIMSATEEFYQSSLPLSLSGGTWSTSQPTWTEGKYIWRRTKITYGDGSTAYSPSENGICITGNTGPQGIQGEKGDKGDTGATGAKGSPGVDYSRGKMIHVDPMFISGTNNCEIYNNKSNGTVTVTRSSKSSDNPMTGTNYELVIKNTGEASPGLGGYVQSISSRANAIFIRRIIAKIPVGYSINNAENSLGTGYSVEWLTSKAGTGKFTEYIYKYICGATGTFSSGGRVYIDGTVGTTSEPVTWYVAYSTTFDMTNVSDVSESAKTATNFMSFDSTNGLLVGNKTSGSWSGTRAQIKSDTFNILDSSGTTMASYGATTTIGKSSANNVYIDSDSIDIRKGTSILATFDQYGLKIANSNDASGSLGSGTSKPALVIGSETGYHIEMDNNEIMAKSNATATSHLFLNMEGGNVSVNNNCDRAMMFQEGALYAKNKNYNSGNWLGIIDSINENGNTTFGYGGYLQEIGTTNIYGNDIYLYSKGNINTNTSFVVKNGSSFQGTNTSGELRNNLQPCNTNDNCVIGYGSYNAGEGATNIYGKTISLTYDNLKLNGVDYDSGWKTPSISSSLSVYGSDSYNAIKYRKVGKVVDICGAVSPASTSTLANGDAVTVFTLPQAYRPSYTRTYVCHGSGRDVFMVQVQSAGGVTISRYRSTTSTSNAYPTSVATTNWLPISVTFTVD